MHPLHYFLNLLIEKIDLTTSRPKDSKQFFELLKTLLNMYFEEKRSVPEDLNNMHSFT